MGQIDFGDQGPIPAIFLDSGIVVLNSDHLTYISARVILKSCTLSVEPKVGKEFGPAVCHIPFSCWGLFRAVICACAFSKSWVDEQDTFSFVLS